MKRCRGFTLMETMMTISLVTVGLTLSTKLTGRILTAFNELAESRRETAVMDAAVHRLRVDLEQSQSLSLNGQSLKLSAVTWAASGTALTRTAGDRVEQFDVAFAQPRFADNPTGVRLTIDSNEWMLPAIAKLSGGQS